MTEVLYQKHSPVEQDFDPGRVRRNVVIIHYCSRNKPWKEAYIRKLDDFCHEAVARMRKRMGDPPAHSRNVQFISSVS